MSTNPPQGFLFSACAAGIKASGKPDLALALVPEGASAAAMFTRNQIVAAPVTVGREHLRRSQGLMRAVLVNAGNANCATGKQGLKAAASVCAGLAKQIKASPHQVFPSSTGIIGVQLTVEKIHAALPHSSGPAAATRPPPTGSESRRPPIISAHTEKNNPQKIAKCRWRD